MTFDEWWTIDFPTRAESERDLASRIWQAAQKEAAKRCAEIALNCAINGRDADKEIEREFGLDKS